jgi:hypothetical protein
MAQEKQEQQHELLQQRPKLFNTPVAAAPVQV